MPRNIIAFIAIAAVAIGVCSLASCAMDPEIVTVFGGGISVPKLVSVETRGSREIRATFSLPVTVTGASVIPGESAVTGEPGSGADQSIPITASWEESPDEPGEIAFILDEAIAVGSTAYLSATVEDSGGNSLSFSVPFIGYNERPPRLLINEIRTDYVNPKVEFIEFFALSDGNLAGVEISCAADKSGIAWSFPSAEVRAGDYVMYHLRSVEDGLVNETGSTDASGGTEARADARDFWDNRKSSPLKETNVIVVRERKGGTILDALLVAEPDKASWPTDAISRAASEVVSVAAWKGDGSVATAASALGMTPTRTLGRNPGAPDTDSAADWALCPKLKASPGTRNISW
ncbi:MAG TPA: hypothetical protein PKO22_06190 [Treponemataceae bacterium]|nr:hypothetical protein [Treponemataceae bacterium]